MADKSKFIEFIDEALEKSKETALSRLFFTYQGIPYPVTMCTSETFQALDAFEARHDDIVLASYPKCGSNWILHIVRELIFAVSKKKYEYPEFPVLECGDSGKYQRMKQFPSPRILATHLHYDKLPESIFKNKAKILVIFRNPKDTAVSFFHFHNNVPDIPSYGSWDEFFRQFMKGQVSWGSYFDFAINWNKHLDDENVKFILYEDLKENLTDEIKQIAEFLGFSLTEEQIQTISAKSTFPAMRAASQETHGAVGPFLFRKGEVGDWKNLFSGAQNQEMDEKFEKSLAGTSLGAKLKYESYCQC
ncbi:PREDICTED: sulfotransferase 6B1 isoform X1 [Propithecus coquereli]|uniref:Sulfotransferase n=1 Tax=Propithecus coquereli TaxID=379532 RepID=A0A2K6EYG9_PROCO|nr:PREDICTED: sulfotransferase 6B1 isoform X1 [Propithecus coquereli]